MSEYFENIDRYCDSDNEDNIREPIPSKNIRMLDDEEEYIEYKKKIMNDNTLDVELKKILLKSREEYIISFREKTSINKINKQPNYFHELIYEIEKEAQISQIFLDNKHLILDEINRWINNEIDILYFNFDIYWEIYLLLEKMNIDYYRKKKILEIIQPLENTMTNNIDIINEIQDENENKNENDNENKIKEIEKIIIENYEIAKLQELEDKKNRELIETITKLEIKKQKELEEKKNRNNNISILLLNFKKIGILDKNINNLKNELDIPIQKYLNLETDMIILNKNIFENLNIFLNTIRINIEQRDNIIKICNII